MKMRQIDIETLDESEIAIQMTLNNFCVVCRCHCCIQIAVTPYLK